MSNVSNKPGKVTIDDFATEVINKEVLDSINQIECGTKIELKSGRLSVAAWCNAPLKTIVIIVIAVAVFLGYHNDKIPIINKLHILLI